MPVYLCRSGAGKDEPWQYGIQVYSAPFLIEESKPSPPPQGGSSAAADGASTGQPPSSTPAPSSQQQQQHPPHQPGGGAGRDLVVATWAPDENEHQRELQRRYSSLQKQPLSPLRGQQQQQQRGGGSGGGAASGAPVVNHPIRRIKHAEIVLVDDVCVSHERYWLRLRWPGHKGGFAGYIAMGHVSDPKSKGTCVVDVGACFFLTDNKHLIAEQEYICADVYHYISIVPRFLLIFLIFVPNKTTKNSWQRQ